jgi:hypothetical protein
MNHHQEDTMKCPSCTETALVMSDRQGVEIDYCPQCRGVWLDRGELDKLIERSAAMAPTPASSAAARSPPSLPTPTTSSAEVRRATARSPG